MCSLAKHLPRPLVATSGLVACGVTAALALSAAAAETLATRTLEFSCDGQAGELPYLVRAAPDRINHTIPAEGPCRWTEVGWEVVYRFPLTAASTARIELKAGNRYQFEAAADGRTWQVIQREDQPAAGLSNCGWKTADLTPFLGSEYVYLRMTHSLPDQPGFGGCLFAVKLTYTAPDPALPLVTVGRALAAPVIDADLGDPAWAAAQALTPFWILGRPTAARQQTVARLTWDDLALYVSVHCLDAKPDSILSVVRQRDGEVYRDAAVELFLQPPGERYYHLAVNSIGTQYDEIGANAPTGWNPDWESRARVVADGWVAEVRIPFASLGVATPAAGDVWRLNVCRVGTSSAEICTWAPLAGGFHTPAHFGFVRFAERAPAALSVRLPAACQRGDVVLTGSVIPPTTGVTVAVEVVPDAGNVTRATTTPQDGRFSLAGNLRAWGNGRFAVSLADAAGALLYRLVAPYTAPEPQAPPLLAQLKQPYYSDEGEIELRLRTNLPPEQRAPARLTVTLRQGERVLSSRELPAAAELQIVTFPLAELAVGDYQISTTLRGAAAEPLGASDLAVHRLASEVHPSRVEIRDGGTTYLNGKPFFPIIFFLAGGNPEVGRAGNTVLFGGEDPEGCARGLDDAARFGLLAMPHLCNLLRGKNDFDGLRATVARNKNHPALLSWYLADEPEGSGDTPELLAQARQILREIDPNHPVSGCNNTPAVFSAYAPVLDIHLVDPYPIPFSPLTTVSDWTAVSRAAAGPERPSWLVLQTHDLSRYGVVGGRYPSADELRCMMYLALAGGAKGIGWWAYGHARESNWERYCELAAEIKVLEPYLLSAEGDGGIQVTANSPALPLLVRKLGERALLLAVNPGAADIAAQFTIAGMTPTRVTRCFEDAVTPVTAARFTANVPALGRAVFTLE
jgi:hypothetical protein